MELMEAIKTEMLKREEHLRASDPHWQRLRGMLDVAEGKVQVVESSEEPNIEEGND